MSAEGDTASSSTAPGRGDPPTRDEDGNGGSNIPLESSKLETNRAAWSAGRPGQYRLTYTSECGENSWVVFDPVTVEVDGFTPTVVEGPDYPIEVATVEKLFAIIEEAVTANAEMVSVTYGEYGQPMEVDLDFDDNAIDDEFCVSITAFDVP